MLYVETDKIHLVLYVVRDNGVVIISMGTTFIMIAIMVCGNSIVL